jgi:hypothetical protein
LLLRHFLDWGSFPNPRITDHDIDLPESLSAAFEQVFHHLPLRKVARAGNSMSSGEAKFLKNLLGRFMIPVIAENNVGAGPSQAKTGGLSNSAGSPGYKNSLPGQVNQLECTS